MTTIQEPLISTLEDKRKQRFCDKELSLSQTFGLQNNITRLEKEWSEMKDTH